jgi:leucine dehydrogenase
MLDLGDAVEGFGGRYGVGEDVGTSAEDMVVVRERTPHAFCLPTDQGGTGEPSEPTALGVYASLGALAERLFNTSTLAGRDLTIVGLGQVGGRLAQRLAADGAVLTVTDVDPSKRDLAEQLGARWIDSDTAYVHPSDVLVPSALGGAFTRELVPRLQTRVICGPANNQLSEPGVADLLAARGIVWAPDFLVNAGGVIHGVLADMQGHSATEVAERAQGIAVTLHRVLDTAERLRVTPAAAATTIANERLAKARVS